MLPRDLAAAATLSSASAVGPLPSLASVSGSECLLLVRQDIVDGGAGPGSNRLHGAPGISIPAGLHAVRVGLLENRGDSPDLGGRQGETLRHPLNAVVHSFRVAGGAKGLELRALCRRQDFADEAVVFAAKGPQSRAVFIVSLGAAEGAHLLTVPLANGANLFLLIVAQVELSHQMSTVAMASASSARASSTLAAGATVAAAGTPIGCLACGGGIASLSEAHLRRHEGAEGQREGEGSENLEGALHVVVLSRSWAS